MVFEFEFIDNWSSSEKVDQPSIYLESLPDEIAILVLKEIKLIVKDPFNPSLTHELREPWDGFYGWYPNKQSKIKDYRIVYMVRKKVQIYRIGHHSVVYRK